MPVVYLHPVGLDGTFWRDVAVPSGLTPHLPGFGGTPPPTGLLSFARLVDFVAGLLPDGERADLVGLSLGSMLAQQVAVRRPELVRSVVLACGAMSVIPEALRERAAITRKAGMAGVLDSTLERWFTPKALRTEGHPGVAYSRTTLLDDDAETFARYWEAMAEHDVSDAIGELRVPATVVAATGDKSVSVAAMRALAERISGAHFVEIEGPHMAPLEDAPTFAAVVSRHLQRLAS